jgi:hypothetical protein
MIRRRDDIHAWHEIYPHNLVITFSESAFQTHIPTSLIGIYNNCPRLATIFTMVSRSGPEIIMTMERQISFNLPRWPIYFARQFRITMRCMMLILLFCSFAHIKGSPNEGNEILVVHCGHKENIHLTLFILVQWSPLKNYWIDLNIDP